MLKERDYSDEFLKYARSRQGSLTDKYLADLLEAMTDSASSMIKNKQLSTFNEQSIPVYKQILRGRGYTLGTITHHPSSDTYTAPIFISTYRTKQSTKPKTKRCRCKNK